MCVVEYYHQLHTTINVIPISIVHMNISTKIKLIDILCNQYHTTETIYFDHIECTIDQIIDVVDHVRSRHHHAQKLSGSLMETVQQGHVGVVKNSGYWINCVKEIILLGRAYASFDREMLLHNIKQVQFTFVTSGELSTLTVNIPDMEWTITLPTALWQPTHLSSDEWINVVDNWIEARINQLICEYEQQINEVTRHVEILSSIPVDQIRWFIDNHTKKSDSTH